MNIRATFPCMLVIVLTTGAFATVIKPEYAPTDSSPDSASASNTPEKMVDNSGMTPAIWTGTSLAHTVAATHVFNALADDSWQTNDPLAPGGHYFGEATSNPMIVFDLGRDHPITTLFFWQFQRNLPPGSWAKDIEVRFAADPGAGPLGFPAVSDLDITLKSPAELGPFNLTQDFDVPGTPTARYIQLTITDNRGGPRVGLGEFRVKVGDEPLLELPAAVDISGDLLQRTINVRVDNPGNKDFLITSAQVSVLTGSGQFLVSPLPPLVPAHGNALIPVTYTPGGIGDRALLAVSGHADPGLLSLATSADGDPDSITIKTSLVWPSPTIDISGMLEIGPYPKGVGIQRFPLEVFNVGWDPGTDLKITGVKVSGEDSARFPEAKITLPAPIPKDGGNSIDCAFDPAGNSAPDFHATLLVNNNDETNDSVPVEVTAHLLEDLEISIPSDVSFQPSAPAPTSSIPVPSGTSSVVAGAASTLSETTSDIPITMTTGTDTNYSFAEVSIISSDGGFTISYPSGTIASGDEIMVQFTHGATTGIYSLAIQVKVNKDGEPYSDFVINLTVKVRNPVELVARGFVAGGFKVGVSNVLPGETFRLTGSTDLVNWSPIGGPITSDGDVVLPLTPDPSPSAMFFRMHEVEVP